MTNFFHGKAESYAKFRPKFPLELFLLLEEKLGLNVNAKKSQLLDLGCGTGHLTIPLSKYFSKTVAVDPAPDMLECAKKIAAENGCVNIEFLEGYAEDLPSSFATFDLISIANAFHWMKEDVVVPWILQHLNPNGALLLIGSYKSFFEDAKTAWHKALVEATERWFGEQKSKVIGNYNNYKESWEQLLQKYVFSEIKNYKVAETRLWNINSILGYLSSISFIPSVEADERIKLFKNELRESLLKLNNDGEFFENHEISVLIARK
jgi:ubiquinone/menaquinone biosynthesis C-methylase UbiE